MIRRAKFESIDKDNVNLREEKAALAAKLTADTLRVIQ